ncbi:hypothetical protein POX_f08388 [Penicillium oxalicum]|uniref:Uncharacterized protein n=1 Tax=Penicillium oxalicum (strain 114-2 / CGMCC 5302) TaxID=933388 RepID=S7ZGH2_PENO1|nr:hypothetical protein POX_f08388 [Penicillium oxalicum]EPS29349.1 hypothetical protein PDE_04298 [Penicillium oxalicum 114-2]KAI2788005.1 hypothetical protein POX_f08388 [Penicillium oxalicum]
MTRPRGVLREYEVHHPKLWIARRPTSNGLPVCVTEGIHRRTRVSLIPISHPHFFPNFIPAPIINYTTRFPTSSISVSTITQVNH